MITAMPTSTAFTLNSVEDIGIGNLLVRVKVRSGTPAAAGSRFGEKRRMHFNPGERGRQLFPRQGMTDHPVAGRTYHGIPSNERVALRTAFHLDTGIPGGLTVPVGIQMGFDRFIEYPISEITNTSKQQQGLHRQ